MELRYELIIDAPAERVWHTLGERFMHVSDWAAPIIASRPVGPAEPGVGVTRSCNIAPVGPVKAGVVHERLTKFDRDEMAFEYEALAEGMPSFISHAVNHWSIARIDGGRSLLRTHATISLRGPIRLFGCVIKWQMRAAGARVLEELKYFVETGRPHPRKLSAALPD